MESRVVQEKIRAQNQQRNHCEQKNKADPAKDTFADAVVRNGNIGECRHESIVAD